MQYVSLLNWTVVVSKNVLTVHFVADNCVLTLVVYQILQHVIYAKHLYCLLLLYCHYCHLSLFNQSYSDCSMKNGIFNYRFTTNSLLSMLVKEFWKSVNIWPKHKKSILALFYLHGVVMTNQYTTATCQEVT